MKTITIKNSLTLLVPFLIILSSVFLVKSPLFIANSRSLSIGITLDLILMAPLIYFLFIRKTTIPKTTVVPLFIIGIAIASFIIPQAHQNLLTLIKTWVLPIVEISVVTYMVIKIRKIIKSFRAHQTTTFDFYASIKEVAAEILPQRISTAFATEIAVFYYGFLNWTKIKLVSNEYSYHKNSSAPALLYVFILLINVESVAVHLLLAEWNIILAWVLTILSIYSAFQLFGFVRSLSKRPTFIDLDNKILHLKYGILAETNIEIDNIENIEITTREFEKESGIIQLSPLGALDSYNIIIHLKSENELSSFYGLKKTYKSIAFHIDQKEEFVTLLIPFID